jgi:hypothetical protein
MTPLRSKSSRSSIATTPTSVSTCGSDYSDYMPMTPTSPIAPSLPSDDYASAFVIDSDKENYPSSAAFEPAINKQHIDCAPEQYLPHDFVAYGRPALHNYNMSSPAVA